MDKKRLQELAGVNEMERPQGTKPYFELREALKAIENSMVDMLDVEFQVSDEDRQTITRAVQAAGDALRPVRQLVQQRVPWTN